MQIEVINISGLFWRNFILDYKNFENYIYSNSHIFPMALNNIDQLFNDIIDIRNQKRNESLYKYNHSVKG